jgi:hypothetical protein
MQIAGYQAYKMINRLEKPTVSRKEPVKEKSHFAGVDKDTVKISSESKQKRLEMIKQRVKEGYYSTSDVKEDITNKLTHVFDAITG